jgi:hypothetical protein
MSEQDLTPEELAWFHEQYSSMKPLIDKLREVSEWQSNKAKV